MIKRIIFIILLFTPIFLYADDCSDCKELLISSNESIELAINKINTLKAEIVSYNKLLEEANLTIENSNQLLAKADILLEDNNKLLEDLLEDIDDYQLEITTLRKRIKDLITTGVEIKTYDLNLMIFYGYPQLVGFEVGYNLPFFTPLGIIIGAQWSFDQLAVSVFAGLKLNLEFK